MNRPVPMPASDRQLMAVLVGEFIAFDAPGHGQPLLSTGDGERLWELAGHMVGVVRNLGWTPPTSDTHQ